MQLDRARSYIFEKLGVAPVGLWPSEGSVSDEALALAAHAGFTWAASDNGVLARTLNRDAGVDVTYRAYILAAEWPFDAHDFPRPLPQRFDRLRIFPHERCTTRPDISWIASAKTRKAANVWCRSSSTAKTPGNGTKPMGVRSCANCTAAFSEDPDMEALTVSEALAKFEAEPLHGIFPGSWINANFNVWIGAEEDNQAWELLLAARRAYDETPDVPESAPQTGLRRTADRRRQRLELVVWARARLRQSAGVRPALSRSS